MTTRDELNEGCIFRRTVARIRDWWLLEKIKMHVAMYPRFCCVSEWYLYKWLFANQVRQEYEEAKREEKRRKGSACKMAA